MYYYNSSSDKVFINSQTLIEGEIYINYYLTISQKSKLIVHIIGVTKALTKIFISILLIRFINPLYLPKVNSQRKGIKTEFKNVKKVNFIL